MAGLAELPRDLVTLEQWDALELDEARRWELVEGGIVMTPRPRPLHQIVSGNLRQLIRAVLPESLAVLQEVEITVEARFPPTVRDPDLVVVNRSVVDRNPVRVDAHDVALVVEIVSPGSRRTDRVMKLYEYAKADIEHYWIVDLDSDAEERFLVHRIHDGTYQRVEALVGERVRTGEPVTLDFTLDELTRA
ncbi:Uma2 family endonuclease [Mycobacterium sp. TNTM28]|uniref:Uma2 family endonuclease n=1 Tax=[Mycobacterium] fortunisiensis TaxID=2600579 RepID=A0ABS6KG70_9MYCO|nr:Uma2 family endonuclease [[Mycobacterium] fortunisiensis]MBU9762544.1 Uma2 family endonuclease [[Mycobacterium] fortunisiensis]